MNKAQQYRELAKAELQQQKKQESIDHKVFLLYRSVMEEIDKSAMDGGFYYDLNAYELDLGCVYVSGNMFALKRSKYKPIYERPVLHLTLMELEKEGFVIEPYDANGKTYRICW